VPDRLIGTSGYSYRDWVGPVYPPGTPPGEFLDEYQKFFSFTEINSSYYAIPRPELCESMVRRTRGDFRFSIKTHKSFTHDHGLRIGPSLEQQIQAYLKGIAPLAAAGKLAGILAQFPWSFHYDAESRRYLAAAAELFHRIAADILPGGTLSSAGSAYGREGGCPLFVEFRSAEWISAKVRRGLEEYSLYPVFQDCPDLDRLPGHLNEMIEAFGGRGAASLDKTAGEHPSPGYIRFHGRNSANWWTGTNVSRYDYLYEDRELASLLQAVRSIEELSRPYLIIAFNNHHRGQAVQNARSLQLLLEGEA
jgi:uncharacterized protein YecE (DUF72 family)